MANYYDVVRMLRTVNEAIVGVWRCTDGGWNNRPPKEGQPRQTRQSGVWSTAQGILWCLQYDPAGYPDKIAAVVNRLIATQHTAANGAEITDGGWGSQLEGPSDGIGTALTVLALVRHVQRTTGDIPRGCREAISGGLTWLIAAYDRDGGWGSQRSRPSAAGMFCGCLALMEYAESGLPENGNVERVIDKAVKVIGDSRRGGGWAQYLADERADPIGTAYCTAILLSGDYATRESCREMARAGAQWLLMNHRKHNGIWVVKPDQSEIEAVAWAAMALLASGEIAEAEPAVTYLTEVGNPQLGWPTSPGPDAKPRLFSTYYGALALLQYRDAKRKARAFPPSQTGNRVFVIRQTADTSAKSAVIGDVRQLIQQCGLTPVPLEGGTFEVLSERIEREAQKHGIDYAIVVIEDAIASSGALDVAGKLTGEIGPEFVTVLYEREKPYPQGLTPVRLVHLRQSDWRKQVTDNLRNAKLGASDHPAR